MKNIFEEAVFADRFRTRDGRRALYLYGTTLWVDGNENETTYSPDGSFGYRNGLGNLDIVSKEEPPYSQCNALNLIHYLDEHCYEGKMCFSNMECADLEKAFDSGDWAKVIRYINKYLYK